LCRATLAFNEGLILYLWWKNRPLDQVAYPSEGCESIGLILPYLNVGSGDLCLAGNFWSCMMLQFNYIIYFFNFEIIFFIRLFVYTNIKNNIF